MESYLEGLCIFICLGDLLGNFLPSPKYEKLYRYTAGVLVLLLIVQPLGKNVAELLEAAKGGINESFQERIAGQSGLWDAGSGTKAIEEETDRILESYLGRMSEDEMKEELTERGYGLTGEEGAAREEKAVP